MTLHPHALPRTHRLGGHGTFAAVRDRGRRVTCGPLVAWFVPNDRKHARLGISIGRMVGNAVRRNAIKRRLREAFRQWPPPTAVDMVVQVRKHEAQGHDAYRAWWRQLVESDDRSDRGR